MSEEGLCTDGTINFHISRPVLSPTIAALLSVAQVWHKISLECENHLVRSMATTLLSKAYGEEAKSLDHVLKIGTRKSKLALLQTDATVNALASSWPAFTFEIKARDTAAGDIDKVTPFKDMPVKNIWTHDLEALMIEGQLDILVHSLKGG